MNKNIISKIEKKVKKGEEISPFLLLSQNQTSAILELNNIVSELQSLYSLPTSYILRQEDDDQSLKVSHARNIIEKSLIRPQYEIQIFIIENISRMTLGFSNALLKFLEEPWVWNIVFLTNSTQSGILDTVLSRVQITTLHSSGKTSFTEYIESLIQSYVENNNTEIIWYYFSKQVEKQDAFDFLYALVSYIKKSGKFAQLLSDIDADLQGLWNNNFLPKYTIDKYLLLLQES
jgi:DNA polymerase III delta prime subunit